MAMEEAAEFQDWELLHGPDAGVAVAVASFAHASAAAAGSRGVEGRPDDVIRSGYFTLDWENRSPRRSSSSDGDREGNSLPHSENPCGVEPGSDSGLLRDEPSGGGWGFSGAEFPRADPGGFWTRDDGQETPQHEHIEEELNGGLSSPSEVVFAGVHPNGGEGEGEVAYLEGNGETDAVEVGGEESGESNPGDGPKTTVAAESPVERSNGNSSVDGLHVAKGEKAGVAWWRLPMEILKFCAFRIRPVWSISIAAAVVGFVILRRRLYMKKPKSRSIPLKVALDDKRVSQFMTRAARLNEAFSAVRRVPVIRSTLATAGVTPWPAVALR